MFALFTSWHSLSMTGLRETGGKVSVLNQGHFSSGGCFAMSGNTSMCHNVGQRGAIGI